MCRASGTAVPMSHSQRRVALRRAVMVAMIVGSLLVAINHGDHIMQEPVCSHFYVKCLASYAVPFLVSFASAMLALRENRRPPT